MKPAASPASAETSAPRDAWAFRCACGDSMPTAPMLRQHLDAHDGEPHHYAVPASPARETPTRRRIYIAGPMRGLPDHNFPAFNRAAARFRALGWHVENPVEIGEEIGNGNPNIPGGEYLRADVQAIATCGAIALLPGWERSTGARAEVALAVTIGLDFYDAGTMQRMEAPRRVVICGGYEKPAGAVDTLDAVVEDILAWQVATFTHRTPHSITKHLLKEAQELHAAPGDDEEWADVFFLAVALIQDGTPNAPRDLIGALRAKLAKNKARTWGEPDADGVVEHIAEGVA